MLTRKLLMSVATLSLVLAACASVSVTSGDNLEIAPLFSVPTADGEFVLAAHLADDQRPVFLNLWASWCFPCREEMPAIDRSAQAFPGVQFIGIAVQDDRPDSEGFVNEIGITYLIGYDEDNSVDAAYRPLGLPASYIISGDGVILERIFGKVTEEDLAEKFAKYFDLQPST